MGGGQNHNLPCPRQAVAEEEPEGDQGLEGLEEEQIQQVAAMAVEAEMGVWNGVEIHHQTHHSEEPENEETCEDVEEPEGDGMGETQEDTGLAGAQPEGERTRIVWQNLGFRNKMEVDAERGYVWLHTNEPRRDLAVPDELPYPYGPSRFHSERYTRCERRDARRMVFMVLERRSHGGKQMGRL